MLSTTVDDYIWKDLKKPNVLSCHISVHSDILIIFNKENALVKFQVLVIVPNSLNYRVWVRNRPRVTKAFQVQLRKSQEHLYGFNILKKKETIQLISVILQNLSLCHPNADSLLRKF